MCQACENISKQFISAAWRPWLFYSGRPSGFASLPFDRFAISIVRLQYSPEGRWRSCHFSNVIGLQGLEIYLFVLHLREILKV